MVKTLKVRRADAEKAKQFLLEKSWLDKTRIIGKTELMYIILSVNEKADLELLKKKFAGSKIEVKNMPFLPPVPGNLKELLKSVVPEKYLDKVIKSYDVVGDIAILEVPKEIENFDVAIAHALKRANPYIKTVVRKAGKIGTEFRLRPLKHLTGEKRTTTLHKEHGVALHIDISKAYFSTRSSGERFRIANLVKPDEEVLVMFAGIGVYALIIAKFQPRVRIWAIEKNPEAVKYMEQNIRANHAGHAVTPILGDVSEKVPELGIKFDRIIMPYPEKAKDFLELAFKYVKPHGVIHYYSFVHEKDVEKHINEIEKIAKKQGKSIEIQNWRKAGSFAPRVWRMVFDILVD